VSASGATALAEALQTLDAQARAAKRAEAASRRQAREIRRTMDDLRRVCRELGIEIAETPRRSE
jgi:hypothetical protein